MMSIFAILMSLLGFLGLYVEFNNPILRSAPEHANNVMTCLIWIAGCLFVAVLPNILKLILNASPGYTPRRPEAVCINSCTVEVYGDVDKLQRNMFQVAQVASWEHIGPYHWRIHLVNGDAAYVTEAINIAQDGTT